MISTRKISVAQTVLNLVLASEEIHWVEGHVEMFENCREQGYKLCFYQGNVRTIAFSEHRSSDDIVVYSSTQHESGGVFGYSDEFWECGKHFRYNEFHEAVKHIIGLIVDENKEG
ncbi:hypothetical protein Thu_169 [Bacillus phage Thurquoise]|uniref:Uncharacterized protein n=1 Tax=Bacillus phage Deep Blue TaxID=1792245 RepID=A0A140HLT0_9CAUD|nr:hypothetical protein Blue_119 [Bacillus phage Deep Blue]AMO25942.1 hypothetical protein Blue_119 [Bacillus phage Deep Blue]UXQ89012.1 hypothetical protein Thu_169 [Bacillus phage Thurquoise]